MKYKNKLGLITLVLNILMTASAFTGNFFVVRALHFLNIGNDYIYIFVYVAIIILLIAISFLVKFSFKQNENRKLSTINLVMLVVNSLSALGNIIFMTSVILFGF